MSSLSCLRLIPVPKATEGNFAFGEPLSNAQYHTGFQKFDAEPRMGYAVVSLDIGDWTRSQEHYWQSSPLINHKSQLAKRAGKEKKEEECWLYIATNEQDILWAIKGAGTNFGIEISVTFRSRAAPAFMTKAKISHFDDKGCVFLKEIGHPRIASALINAIETRPTPKCYLHLVHGGGAIRDVGATATAFGCRDWNYACVICGIWNRDYDQTSISYTAEQWVYQVVKNVLPFSSGVYGANLG